MEQVVEGVRRLLPYSMQRVLPFLRAAQEAEESVVEDTKLPTRTPGLQRAPRRYFEALSKALAELPPELILNILNEAGFYTRYISERLPPCAVMQHESGRVIARTPKLSSYGISALRKIVFRFSSHDQGFSSEPREVWGTFEHSHTWFEAVITDDLASERLSAPSIQTVELQRNRHASRDFEQYEFCFSPGNSIFASLAPGDSIALTACALYPAWRNFVDWAEVELAWTDTFDDRQPDVFIGETCDSDAAP